MIANKFVLHLLVLACATFIALAPAVRVANAQDAETALDSARSPSNERISESLDEILAGNEYRDLTRRLRNPDTSETPQWLQNFYDWLFGDDGSDTSFDPTPAIPLAKILTYIAVAILIGLIIAVLFRILTYANDNGPDDEYQPIDDLEAIAPTRPPGERPSNEYRDRAVASASRGDFRRGIRELVLGAMAWTERADLIRYRKGRTNRDYVRAVWRDRPRRESMLEIVSAFELVYYGHRQAGQPAFDRCLAEFDASFVGDITKPLSHEQTDLTPATESVTRNEEGTNAVSST